MKLKSNFTKIPNAILKKDTSLKPIHRIIIAHLLMLSDSYTSSPTKIAKHLNTTFYSINNCLIDLLENKNWSELVKDKIPNADKLKMYSYGVKRKKPYS